MLATLAKRLLTSLAAAMTAGLAAYLLKLAQLRQLKNKDGTTVAAAAATMRTYIIDKGWSRGSVTIFDRKRDRNGIWSGLELN